MPLRLSQPADSLCATPPTSAGIIKISSAGRRTGLIDLRQGRDMLSEMRTNACTHTPSLVAGQTVEHSREGEWWCTVCANAFMNKHTLTYTGA